MSTESRLPAHILCQQPRTPPSFHGDVFEDAEDWLETFERVARYNGWSDERKLHNVYFALEESARTWFENHEASFPSWEAFCRNLLATFPNADRRERAEAALHSRNQRPNESVRMFFEDMTRLFKRADPSMSEDKKLRHLMRGVKQELFAGLVRSPPRTVAEFLSEAATMEKTLQQRARQYNRDVNAFGPDTCSMHLGSAPDDLRELIRSVVREELQALRTPSNMPSFASLTDVVRDEVRLAAQQQASEVPLQLDARPTYASVLRQAPTSGYTINAAAPSVRPPGPPRDPALPAYERTRKSQVWRAPDRRPLCYHCGEAGHLYRACPYRRVGLRGFAPDDPCPRNGERPLEIASHLLERQNLVTSGRRGSRSPSPMRYRSPSPRGAQSYSGRRSPSPRREN